LPPATLTLLPCFCCRQAAAAAVVADDEDKDNDEDKGEDNTDDPSALGSLLSRSLPSSSQFPLRAESSGPMEEV
jgi:hypothetical protein